MAIAAAAIGGNSLAGGRGGLLGALLGAAVIFLIENLLGALGLSSFWSPGRLRRHPDHRRRLRRLQRRRQPPGHRRQPRRPDQPPHPH